MRSGVAVVTAVTALALLAACDHPADAPRASSTTGATSDPATTEASLGPAAMADCEVVLGVIGEVVQHPDTAEAVNADPALADEPATREAFDAVAVRFAALEPQDPAIAAATALVAERALDVALAEGTAVDLVGPYSDAFVALSDLCATAADQVPLVSSSVVTRG